MKYRISTIATIHIFLENKLLAYYLSRKFINIQDKHSERSFSKALIGADEAANIYENNKSKFEYPVLESICYYESKHPDCNLLSVVNNVLENKGLNGLIMTKDDLKFTTLEHGDLRGRSTFIVSFLDLIT